MHHIICNVPWWLGKDDITCNYLLLITTQRTWGVHVLGIFTVHESQMIITKTIVFVFVFGFFPFSTQETSDDPPGVPSSIENISRPEIDRPTSSFSYLSTVIGLVRAIFDQTKTLFKCSTFEFGFQLFLCTVTLQKESTHNSWSCCDLGSSHFQPCLQFQCYFYFCTPCLVFWWHMHYLWQGSN